LSAKAVLERWSREVISWAPISGIDAYGQRLYTLPVPLRARLDHATKLVRDANGEQVISSTQVYLATHEPIGVLDQITLPDGTTPLLLRVDKLADHQGSDWLRVLFFA
jgi:hypothetical protein